MVTKTAPSTTIPKAEPHSASPDRETLDALRIDRGRVSRGPNVLAVALGLLVLLVPVALLAYWWVINRPQVVSVRTAPVVVTGGANRTLLNASGYVTARREATVSSKITGKVMEVMVEEGMEVEASQVLAKLDSSNAERSMSLAEAQLQLARSALDEVIPSLEHAERELQRIEQMARNQAASVFELDQARTDAQVLRAQLARRKAEVDVAEREVEVWRQQVDDTVIRAPFAGVVTSKNAQPGEMISPMSAGGFTRTGICTIVDMKSLEIEVDVSESYINRVQAGQPVEATLDAYPNWRIPARVIAIVPTADRQKATVKVRIGFEELDPRILPEMSVKVAFQEAESEVAEQPRWVVPKEAVHQDGEQSIVWIVRDGELERRAVAVGDPLGDDLTITAGVREGERVVIEAEEPLAEGIRVEEATQ